MGNHLHLIARVLAETGKRVGIGSGGAGVPSRGAGHSVVDIPVGDIALLRPGDVGAVVCDVGSRHVRRGGTAFLLLIKRCESQLVTVGCTGSCGGKGTEGVVCVCCQAREVVAHRGDGGVHGGVAAADGVLPLEALGGDGLGARSDAAVQRGRGLSNIGGSSRRYGRGDQRGVANAAHGEGKAIVKDRTIGSEVERGRSGGGGEVHGLTGTRNDQCGCSGDTGAVVDFQFIVIAFCAHSARDGNHAARSLRIDDDNSIAVAGILAICTTIVKNGHVACGDCDRT